MTCINKLTKVHKNTFGRPNEKLLTKQVIQQTPLKPDITFIFYLFTMTKNDKTKRKATSAAIKLTILVEGNGKIIRT